MPLIQKFTAFYSRWLKIENCVYTNTVRNCEICGSFHFTKSPEINFPYCACDIIRIYIFSVGNFLDSLFGSCVIVLCTLHQ